MKRTICSLLMGLVTLPALVQAQTPGLNNTVSLPAAAWTGAPVAVSALTTAEDTYLNESDYYMVRGQRIPLRRDGQRMAVKLTKQAREAFASERGKQKRGVTPVHSAALRDALGFTDAEADVSLVQEVDEKGLVIVDVRPKTGRVLGRARMREVSKARGVEYANPAFAAVAGLDRMLLTDEILVRFSDELGEKEVVRFAEDHGLAVLRHLRGPHNTWQLRLTDPRAQSALEAANSMVGQAGVVWSHPDFQAEVRMQSNDPMYPSQWHLHNTGQGGGLAGADVRAPEVWDLGVTAPNIVVAIVDTGVDPSHEDLVIWANPGESGGGRESNGIDDDGDGYVDDYRGWDFYSQDNDPSPGGSHGTACAGVAAARGNNAMGVAGVACGAVVLPIKITSTDSGFAGDAAVHDAIVYAADHADVLSCSWTYSLSESIMDAIDYAVTQGRGGRGTPVFVASGNSAARGWRSYRLSGAPAGTFTVGWKYQTDSSPTGDLNRAWLDNVTLQNGSLQTFSGVTPPALPAAWSSTGAVPWTTVNDPAHAIGDTQSACAGLIGPTNWTRLSVSKNYTVAGDYTFSCWVGPADGDALYAQYYYYGTWVSYAVFYGAYVSFPANYSNSIAVGACNNLGNHSIYSQYGPELDLLAPSGGGTLDIVTTDRTGTNGYSTTAYCTNFSGTSAATPAAAGVAALVLSANPDLTAAEVRQVLCGTADDMETPGFDIYTGYGRVNAYAAVQAALAMGGNRAPVIDARSPTGSVFCVGLGSNVALAVTARAQNGDALSYQWKLNDAVQSASGRTWTFLAGTNNAGPNRVEVVVSDNHAHSTSAVWQVLSGDGDPSLIAHWRLDEKSGRDSSGWGNDLSIEGTVDVDANGIDQTAVRFERP